MFAVDFLEGDVVEWRRTPDGLRRRRVSGYTPSIYAAGPADARDALAAAAAEWPRVVGVGRERWRTSLHADEPAPVVRLDVEQGAPRSVARRIRDAHEPERHPPGTLELYNVDLTPGFRYCLEGDPASLPGDDGATAAADADATPLRTLRVTLPEPALAARDATELRVGPGAVGRTGDAEPAAGDGTGGGTDAAGDDDPDRVAGGEAASLRTLARRLREHDPDVLVLSSADLVPLLAERAAAHDVDLPLGRLDRDPPYRKLAGENTFHSYGRTGHSPARYAVAGRAIVDTSNSFLWTDSRLDGLRYLAGRAGRPLQETAWGSIGTVLTAIQTRAAVERGVLVPWEKWEPERFKTVPTLHGADRGGAIVEPRPGRYEDVWEVDFASLYPNVIRTRNVSPETVGCDCCAGDDVPGLGYTICEDRGFLPDVLAPLIDDRARFKRELAAAEDAGDEARAAALRAKSGAIKWILVSCFGYQGYRNAKFGRIECHEAINAFARDVLLTAKERFEAGGWRVVHGIVDSLWVTPDPARDGDRMPVATLCAALSEAVGIDLEAEARYDWLCLLPRRDGGGVGGRGGALMRYFGREAGVEADPETGAGFKYRGVECRQRSTPPFVAAAQRDLIGVLDRDARPEAVVDRLATHLDRLRAGEVDPAELAVRTRLSKAPSAYDRDTLTAAAVERARRLDLSLAAGRDVSYVVVADGARQPGRVRLAAEPVAEYDPDYYADLLVRAAESVTLPFGWDRDDVRRHLRGERDAALSAFR